MIIAATVVSALFFLFVIGTGIKAQRKKVVTGASAMTGTIGEVIEPLSPAGTVHVQGELWNAESLSGHINKGEKVQVAYIKNLKVYVNPIQQT